MWSVEWNGRSSALAGAQRVLFPLVRHNKTVASHLTRTLERGLCSGIAIFAPDDEVLLKTCHHVIGQACTGGGEDQARLTAAEIAIVACTGATWTLESMRDHVKHVLAQLHVESLDLLLLHRHTLPVAHSLAEQKRGVLAYWNAMIELQRSGHVKQIGMMECSMQEMEFAFTAFPDSPPVALCVNLQVATADPHAERDKPPPTLAALLAFAHARSMDCIVCVSPPYIEASLPPALQEQWQELAEAIATRHHQQIFEVQETHEADRELSRTTHLNMHSTHALERSAQILIQVLLQLGAIVLPIPNPGNTDSLFTDEEVEEWFGVVPHPLAMLPPGFAPHELLSSILPQDDINTIMRLLPLAIQESD